MEKQFNKSSRGDKNNSDVLRASFVKHLGSIKHGKNLKVFPSKLFKETNKIKSEKLKILTLWK